MTTTGANGNFSMLLPAVAGTTTWTLSSQNNDLATNPFLAGTQESISAMQNWPSAISGFSATLNRYYTLTVGGCLSTDTQPAPPADYPTIQIQYELTTAGPWHELGTVGTTTITGCKGAAFLAQGLHQVRERLLPGVLSWRRHLYVGHGCQHQGSPHRDEVQHLHGKPEVSCRGQEAHDQRHVAVPHQQVARLRRTSASC